MEDTASSDQRIAPSTLLLICAGGLGGVVAEAAQISGQWSKIAFLDDAFDLAKTREYPIIGKVEEVDKFVGEYTHALPTAGNNQFRLEMVKRLQHLGFKIPLIIHPRAYVSPSAKLDDGCIVLANAVISRRACLGKACLVNIGAMVDHDCIIGDGVHLPIGIVARNMANIPTLSILKANSVIE